MIFGRIAQSIRTRDWSVLLIELLVVVVGIFLGLQVDDWNEERKENARETAYLERLLADVNEMLANHATHEEGAVSRLEGIFESFDALRSCTLEPEQVTFFENTLLEHQGLERLEVVRSSYDEMVASGALARIDDATLKKQISETYAEAVAAQQFIEYFTADLGRASDIIWRHVSFDLKPDVIERADLVDTWHTEAYSQTVTYDFQELCESATFRNALVEVYDSTKDRLAVGSEFADELRILRVILENRLKG
jgi:hypothetical protein